MPRQRRDKRFIIGITGSFGSGKSAVAGIFASYGARIIDADKIAHRSLSRGSKVYKKIISAFGRQVIGKNEEISRSMLGKIVFNDRKELKKLNSIIHPEIIRVIKKRIKAIKKGVIILDAPLLLEAGLRNKVDKLIVVTVDKNTQLKRLLKKTSLKRPDILKRIKSQISQNVKSRFADFIIDNSGSLARTQKQVADIRRNLWKSWI